MGSTQKNKRRKGAWATIKHLLSNPWIRAGLTLLVVAILCFFLFNNSDLIEEGKEKLIQADSMLTVLAAVAMAAALILQAEGMVVLLRGAGVPIKRWPAIELGLAANAWSSTLPGGPVISAAMIFREQLRWGASTVVAGWYLVISGFFSSAGMAVLALTAVILLGAKAQLIGILLSVATLIAALLAVRWAARNTSPIRRGLHSLRRRFNNFTGAPVNRWKSQLDNTVDELRTVNLSTTRLSGALLLSVLNWLAEILCLLLCLLAIGAEPMVAGVVLSFLAAKLVGQAQLTPGGVGPVDITLTSTLVAFAGVTSAQTLAAVVLFRVVSFLLPAIVGWLAFAHGWILRPHDKRSTTPTYSTHTTR